MVVGNDVQVELREKTRRFLVGSWVWGVATTKCVSFMNFWPGWFGKRLLADVRRALFLCRRAFRTDRGKLSHPEKGRESDFVRDVWNVGKSGKKRSRRVPCASGVFGSGPWAIVVPSQFFQPTSNARVTPPAGRIIMFRLIGFPQYL